MTRIDGEFFDLEMFAIYKSINELLGKDSWKLVWRTGEILISELRGRLGLQNKTPLEAMHILAEYLEKVGYVDKIEVRQIGEGDLEYAMSRPIIAPGAQRLIREGGVPPHLSTSLMFGALKLIFGMTAEMTGEPVFQKDGGVVEKWKISQKT
jgi:hypothetical protein